MQPARIGASLCAGLTLLHYSSFAHLTSLGAVRERYENSVEFYALTVAEFMYLADRAVKLDIALAADLRSVDGTAAAQADRKSTRLNSSHT